MAAIVPTSVNRPIANAHKYWCCIGLFFFAGRQAVPTAGETVRVETGEQVGVTESMADGVAPAAGTSALVLAVGGVMVAQGLPHRQEKRM